MNLDLVTIAKNYLKALKQGKTGKDLAIFFHAEAQQTEMPNRLNPNGSNSSLSTLLERAEKGKKILKSQEYDVKNILVKDNAVVLELVWTGVLNIHFGTLRAGQSMKANVAMFIDFKDGKIIDQRNYDCFEPF